MNKYSSNEFWKQFTGISAVDKRHLESLEKLIWLYDKIGGGLSAEPLTIETVEKIIEVFNNDVLDDMKNTLLSNEVSNIISTKRPNGSISQPVLLKFLHNNIKAIQVFLKHKIINLIDLLPSHVQGDLRLGLPTHIQKDLIESKSVDKQLAEMLSSGLMSENDRRYQAWRQKKQRQAKEREDRIERRKKEKEKEEALSPIYDPNKKPQEKPKDQPTKTKEQAEEEWKKLFGGVVMKKLDFSIPTVKCNIKTKEAAEKLWNKHFKLSTTAAKLTKISSDKLTELHKAAVQIELSGFEPYSTSAKIIRKKAGTLLFKRSLKEAIAKYE